MNIFGQAIGTGLVLLFATVSANVIEITRTPDTVQPYVYALSETHIEVDSKPKMSWQEEVLNMLRKENISTDIAKRVIQCESNWNRKAIGDIDRGTSLGMWQIHQPAHPIGWECASDHICSTEYAIKLIKGKRSWGHWSCY